MSARCVTLLICLAVPALTWAQVPAAAPVPNSPASTTPTWTGSVSLATYFFPDDDDVLQPTVSVDRRALHLEARYNYEDTDSTSVFAGWNVEFGSTVKLELTPMAGFVAGQTDGGIVGAKADLSWRALEAYSEGEYVMPVDGKSFLYSWSEFSVWISDWLRAGAVVQRTRTFRRFRTQREVEAGVLVGLSGSVLEGSFYAFNPGSNDKYYVLSVGVNF